jgi:hypothetical protein
MFGLFSAKCPLDTYEKTWSELRMRWLADRFGIERMLRARLILPTEEFFPDPFEKTYESVRRLMDRLCGYMAIDSTTLGLEICEKDQLPGAAGHYDASGQPMIRIADSQLDDPERLVATLVHELSHEILLGGRLLKRTVADHEWVTDLLPVFLGIGIFGANATVRHEMKQISGGSIWKIGKQGYLTSRVFGYAFALFSLMRGECDPAWAVHLRPDALIPLRQGLRFLKKSDDCLFHPNTIRPSAEAASGVTLAGRLQNNSPTVRLSTLWEIKQRAIKEAQVVSAVAACLKDRDTAVSAAAAEALAGFGPAAYPAVPQLIFALGDHRDRMRLSAVRALGELRNEPQYVVPHIETMLEDSNVDVAIEASRALRNFGASAASSLPKVLAALRNAVVRCKHPLVEALAETVNSVALDPLGAVRDHLSEVDPEVCRLAVITVERPVPAVSRGLPTKEASGGESVA